MSVSVILYRNGSQQIFLSGERNGAMLVLDKLRVAGVTGATDETFDIVAGQELRVRHEAAPSAPALVEPLAPGGDEFRFVPAQFGVTLTATLAASAGTTTYFGRALNASADFSVSLVIRLPLTGLTDPANAPTFATIEGCGRFSIGDSGVEFSTEPLCFQINVEEFPASFPSGSLPALYLGLPDFGFSLPKLRLPWNFTRLPSLPLQMPALSFDFGPLPISVSWKSVEVSQDGHLLIVDVRQLRIDGKVGAIEGDLRVVFLDGQVVFDPSQPKHSFFNLYRPDFQHALRLSFSRWHFDEECALVAWEKGQVNEWLRLIAPDLADADDKESSVALRVLRSGTRLDEIRLDWKSGLQEKKLRLPGFEVKLPAPDFYTLLLHEDEGGEGKRLTLITTTSPGTADNPAVVANSTFTLNRLTGNGNGDKGERERELLQDENPNKELIKFSANPKGPISLALLDVPLGGPSPFAFFKQLDEPLRPLFEVETPEEEPEGLPEPPTECPPTRCKLVSLKKEDWPEENVKLAINLPNNFDFPFLKKGAGQAVSITRADDPKLDFGRRTFETTFDIKVKIGGTLELDTKVTLDFNWETFAFSIRDGGGIKFRREGTFKGEFMGLGWEFEPGKDEATEKKDLLFILTTKDKDYQLKQAPGSKLKVEFAEATAEPLTFEMRDFVLSAGGVSVKGRVLPSPVTLNAVNTKFSFTEGSFEIQENELRDFSISGSGPLPPKLVGDAIADISLQFGQRAGSFQLISGAAQLRGKNLLKCKGTRFEFSVDGLGLKFVNDGKIHFYFTITGRAKFVPLPSDDSSGPLAWLPGIELQLLECPLTSDVSVLSKHVKFLVEMPKKATFDFLGCFKMELRGIGFVPQAPMFEGDTAAMELSGQVMFADGAGDVIEAKVDFHSLFIGLPKPGRIVPQISFRDIAVRVRSGDAFMLEGAVEFFSADREIEPGLRAEGFGGRGSLTIQGLPTFTVAFTFVRVSRDGGATWVRAWFLYVQAGKLSLRIPVINVFVREVGLGFGYRYTLASIKAADEIDDPRKLLAELKKLSRTQGELARRDQWRVDLEEAGQDPRWTFVARALIAQNSAAAGFSDWNASREKELPSIFLLDVVLALRSDLTFLMTGRGWINTNYNDYLEKESLRTSPLLSGFVLLSPKRKRFLANLSSNPGAEFGDHPPLPGFLKDAIRQSSFSATLLIEPGLLHYELGWPNMLRWRAKIGPLEAEFRGGMIFRLSRRELVIGNSYMARGSLELSAQAGGSAIGARLSALARVAYGARYIGVIGFDDPRGRSALYGAVGLEINVRCSIEFWLRIKIGFFKLSINLRFSFSINLTALVEVGITAGNLLGARGTGTVSLSIMGRGLHFKVHVGINEGAVDAAFRITQQYLNIGLEATEVEPVPGSSQRALAAPASNGNGGPPPPSSLAQPLATPPALSSQPLAGLQSPTPPSSAADAAAAAATAAPPAPTLDAALDEEKVFEPPQGYSIFTIPLAEEQQKGAPAGQYYFILLPSADVNEEKDGKQGFLPVPPKEGTPVDFKWEGLSDDLLTEIGCNLDRFDPLEGAKGAWKNATAGALKSGWHVNWKHELGQGQEVKPEEIKSPGGKARSVSLQQLMTNAFITKLPPEKEETSENEFFDCLPVDDPVLPPTVGDVLEDARVHNPSDAAFEAAVRGAVEQFEGSPYFKHEPNSIYEQKLGEAFSPQTTIYSEDGLVEGKHSAAEKAEQAVHMRSVIISQMVTDLQRYVELLRRGQTDESKEVGDLIKQSVAFQLGLVFKTRDGKPGWYEVDGDKSLLGGVGTITQRNSYVKPDSYSEGIEVRPFNRLVYNFHENAPQFQRVRHFADASTVAITWDLVWRESELVQPFPEVDQGDEQQKGQQQPEQHLQHYLVRRRALAGGEQEVEFSVKPVDALNMNVARGEMVFADKTLTLVNQTNDSPNFNAFKDGQLVKISGSTPKNNGFKKIKKVLPKQLTFEMEDPFESGQPPDTITVSALQILRSRFQFVDHFNGETAEDQALLPERGKSYVYTITPVDVTGAHSTRPLTVLATRLPNETPLVPADGELIVKYHLRNNDEGNDFEASQPEPLRPACLAVQWTEPPDPPGKPPVVIGEYSLVFRREAVFPAGSYGHDAESQGSRTSGLPTSNARRLRTDIVVNLEKSSIEVFVDSKTKQKRFHSALTVEDLIKAKGLFSEKEWRPEAWRVFFQTRSVSNVPSALVPVQIALQFFAGGAPPSCGAISEAKRFEERRPGLLEWIAKPVAFGMTPPEDERADVDFASVPMPLKPTAEDKLTGKLDLEPLASDGPKELKAVKFTEHPDRLRCLRFHWNQGPSRRLDEPHNPLELYAGYQLYEFDLDAHTARILDDPPADFLTHLRRAQDLEIMSAADLMLTPSNTLLANQWEAWYPSTVRRRWLRQLAPPRPELNPKFSEAKLNPWYSWRDSYLQWPSDESLFVRDGDAIVEGSVVAGIMSIDKAAQSISLTDGGAENFKAGQYVRISGAHDERNNGVKKIKEVATDKLLTFEANSFFESEPMVGPGKFDSTHVAQGTMSINLPKPPLEKLPSITFAKGGLEIFQPGQFVRVSKKDSQGVVSFVDIKQVASQDDVGSTGEVVTRTTLRFKDGSFTAAETGEFILDNLTLVIYGRPFVGMHPFLSRLVEDLGRIQDLSFDDLGDTGAEDFGNRTKDYAVDLNPTPAAQPAVLDDLLAQTTTLQDPYGWNILKRMGLAAAFTLRDRRTGDVIGQEETRDAVRLLLKLYQKQGQLDAQLSRHLFVEYLFQPAKSARLKEESANQSPEVEDLLALVQVSLRPALQQAFRYRMLEVSAPAGGKVGVKADARCTVIDLAQPTIQNALEAGQVKEVIIPSTGKTTLLFRAEGSIKVSLGGQDVPPEQLKEFRPSDWMATYFTAPAGDWPQKLEGAGDVAEQWGRFKRYLLRLNPPNPASQTDPKIEFPAEDEEDKIRNLMSWLNRFFEASADVAVASGESGAGPWLATAYPRTMTPVGVLPDNAGRLTYNHLIEDQWAHVYRYYFLPSGRYDRLWQSMAQSDILYPPPMKKPELTTFIRPAKEEGGLDVVLDRIREIAPPLVLFSGRLDRKAGAAALAPPGKTWEVIVAKHPEQLLVERNRTLVRRLDYRHLAHTLLRRYAFLPALAQLDEGLRLVVTESPFAPGQKVATGDDETAQLVIREGINETRFDLALKDKNNIEGLAKTINETADIKLQAELVPPIGTPESSRRLVLRGKDGVAVPMEREIRLLARKGDEASDLLRPRHSVADKLRYVVGPENPSLPEPYTAPPEQLPLDKLSVDQWLTVDLPPRIGVFGKGAVAVQWQALPFFYEHRLLLVAQTSKEVVSPISSVVQKDFEYVSPEPAAELEGVSRPDAPERGLFMQLELKNHWACLPSAQGGDGTPAKERWPQEAPPSEGEDLVFSALPDAEVVYQVVLEYESGVTETQAEFFFNLRQDGAKAEAEPACGYKARQLGRKFFATPLRVRPPQGGEGEKLFFLDARLERVNEVALPHPPPEKVTFTGDLTRARHDEKLLALFPKLQLLPGVLLPEERGRVLRRFLAAAEVSKNVSLPSVPPLPPVPEGIEFITGDKLLIVARRFLNQEEQKKLLAFYPDAPDKQAVEQFVKDMDNRRVLEEYLQDWVSEQAISSRKSFGGGEVAEGQLEFPAPMSCALALEIDRARPDEDIAELRAALRKLLSQSPDHSFSNAVRTLDSQLALMAGDPPQFIFAEASVGVEQIQELADNAKLDDANKKVIWSGAATREALETLQRWAELSDFRETFAAVRQALLDHTLKFQFDPADPFPAPEEIPRAVRERLEIVTQVVAPEAPHVLWKGLHLGREEEDALLELKKEKPNQGASFRKAIGDLLDALKGPKEVLTSVAVIIREADWRRRPAGESLPDELLKRRLLVGNGRLRFYGWMTRAEGVALAKDKGRPDESAVGRLFEDSMTRGMDGGRLMVTARRGSAGVRSAVPVSTLRKD